MLNKSIITVGELQAFLTSAKAEGLSSNDKIAFGGVSGGISVRVENVNAEQMLLIDEVGFDPDEN